MTDKKHKGEFDMFECYSQKPFCAEKVLDLEKKV